jgi:phosphoribosylglycinamide formyltransferase 2
MSQKKIMLLGSGELGKEFVISCQRLGVYTIAIDKYEGAPAMQVAHAFEVVDMLDPEALRRVVLKYKPDIIVPEIEAICTEELINFEVRGMQVVPTARAAHLTMNRDAIRDLASNKLKLKTAKYAYAENFQDFEKISLEIGFPSVVKPVMSSSGKGQSVMSSIKDLKKSWDFALQGMRGLTQKVIVEEFIHFDSEITLLTIKQKNGPTLFVDPIGHRQERGDYQESWMPAKISEKQLSKAQKMARQITDELGGAGLFGVEFFLTDKEIYFSELSPRPHDTGLVTLISQNLSEFDLHARAILGLPIPKIEAYGPAASAVILSKIQSTSFNIIGVDKALAKKQTEVRLFGKPEARPYRRMGVALALGKSTKSARQKALESATAVHIRQVKTRA